MQVRMIKMFSLGIELDKRLLNDSSPPQHRGKLTIMDVTDIERRRPVKVAKLLGYGGKEFELRDVHIVWLNDDRMTLTGDERVRNSDGKTVNFKQSWLCTLDMKPADPSLPTK
jgi:hypothetical protein